MYIYILTTQIKSVHRSKFNYSIPVLFGSWHKLAEFALQTWEVGEVLKVVVVVEEYTRTLSLA